jgi:hypothetical protein
MPSNDICTFLTSFDASIRFSGVMYWEAPISSFAELARPPLFVYRIVSGKSIRCDPSAELLVRVLWLTIGSLRRMDSLNCRTLAASPAEPGGLPGS